MKATAIASIIVITLLAQLTPMAIANYELDKGELVILSSVEIMMPANHYVQGDTCSVDVMVFNFEGTTLEGHHLFVVLAAGGSYFFAPSFASYSPKSGSDSIEEANSSEISSTNALAQDARVYYTRDFELGDNEIEIVPEFVWPEGVGAGEATWYSLLVNPEMSEIIGDMEVHTMTWGMELKDNGLRQKSGEITENEEPLEPTGDLNQSE